LDAWNKGHRFGEEIGDTSHPLKNNPEKNWPRGYSDMRKAGEILENNLDDPERVGFGTHDMSIFTVILMLYRMIQDGIGIYTHGSTNYYWYNLAKNIFGLPTKTFILLDYLFEWNLILPTDPWHSYRFDRIEPKEVCPVCPTSTTKEVAVTDGSRSAGDGRLNDDTDVIPGNSFLHIDKDISCEQKYQRAKLRGCVDDETRRYSYAKVFTEGDDAMDF